MNPASKTHEQLWYYTEGETVHGPVAAGRIKELIDSGRLTGQTLVVEEGREDWKRIDSVEGLPLATETAQERVDAPNPHQDTRPCTTQGHGLHSQAADKKGLGWLLALGWFSWAVIGAYSGSELGLLSAFFVGWIALAYVGRKSGWILAGGVGFLVAILAMGVVLSIGEYIRPPAREPAASKPEPARVTPVQTVQSSKSSLSVEAFRTEFDAQAVALKISSQFHAGHFPIDDQGCFKLSFTDNLSLKGEIDPTTNAVEELTIKGQAGDEKLLSLPSLLIATLEPSIERQEREQSVQALVKGVIENAALVDPAEPPSGGFGKWMIRTTWLRSSNPLWVTITFRHLEEDFRAPPPKAPAIDSQKKDEFMVLFRQLQGFRDGSNTLSSGLSFDEWTKNLKVFISKAAAEDEPNAAMSRMHFAANCLQTMALDYKRENGKETYACFKNREAIESNLGTSEPVVTDRLKGDFDAVRSSVTPITVGGVKVTNLGDIIEAVASDERINLDLASRVLFAGDSAQCRFLSYDPSFLYYVTFDAAGRTIPFALKRTPDIEDSPSPGFGSKAELYEDILRGNTSEYDPLKRGYIMVTGNVAFLDLPDGFQPFEQYRSAVGADAAGQIDHCKVLTVRVIHLRKS